MYESYHYPPDLFNLLVEAIPRINKTKKDLLTFFKNVGTPLKFIDKYTYVVTHNPQEISKRDITRQILEVLNSNNDNYLGIRRLLLQRVIDFTAFGTCYPNDVDIAKARISDIKKLISLKDSVTKQEQFLEHERQEKIKIKQQQLDRVNATKAKYEMICDSFNHLFSISSPQERGKSLESVLNNIFSFFRIGIKESFCIADEESGRIYEQIDGVVEINNYLTLVEMKWEKSPIGADKVGRFMGRLLGRHNVDGIIISYSSFTETTIPTAKDGLAYKTIVLCDLQDVHQILIQRKDLAIYFTELIRNTKMYNNPKPYISIDSLPDIDFTEYASS